MSRSLPSACQLRWKALPRLRPKLRLSLTPLQLLVRRPSGKSIGCASSLTAGGICIRYHLGKCKSGKTCRYAHQCPIPNSQGAACGGNHTAARHKAAPHRPDAVAKQVDALTNSSSVSSCPSLSVYEAPTVVASVPAEQFSPCLELKQTHQPRFFSRHLFRCFHASKHGLQEVVHRPF